MSNPASVQPLHIVAKMAEPVVYYGDGMTFDGILAAAWMRDLPYAVTSKWPTASRSEPCARAVCLWGAVMCECVCARESERERKRERGREGGRGIMTWAV